MKFNGQCTFLGYEERVSKKSGNKYILAMVRSDENKAIYNCFVADDRLSLKTNVVKAKDLQKVLCHFEMTSFNGNPQVNLIGMEL